MNITVTAASKNIKLATDKKTLQCNNLTIFLRFKM